MYSIIFDFTCILNGGLGLSELSNLTYVESEIYLESDMFYLCSNTIHIRRAVPKPCVVPIPILICTCPAQTYVYAYLYIHAYTYAWPVHLPDIYMRAFAYPYAYTDVCIFDEADF